MYYNLVKDSITITIEQRLIKKIDEVVESGFSPFRSRSALIEYYLNKSKIDELLVKQEISIFKEEKR